VREGLLVLGVLAALALAGAMWLAEWRTLMWTGGWLLAAGWVLGLPVGVAFHVALRRALGRRGPVPRGWIWRPAALERELDPAERRLTTPLMYVAGSGFGLIVLGLALLVTGMAVALATI
jgi:hypothetical protein